MSGIFGFSGVGDSTENESLRVLLFWNRIYGREKSETFWLEKVGMGNCLEHLSDAFPVGEAIYHKKRHHYVIDAMIYNREEMGAVLGIGDLSVMSDEELMVTLLEEKGFSSLVMVNGDFAGAMYDEEREEWTLFRDHMGVRPLFYYKDDNFFAFSTDMRGLTGLPDTKVHLNEHKFFKYAMGYNSLTLCETEYDAIRCICPASYTVIRKRKEGFVVEPHEYWTLGSKKIRKADDAAYQAELEHLLTDSIRRRLDVLSCPVGGELSGGLDSSLIAVLMNRLGRKGLFFSWSQDPKQLPLVEGDERSIILELCRREGFSCIFSEETDKEAYLQDVIHRVEAPYVNTLVIRKGSQCLHDQGIGAMFTGHGGDEGVSHRSNLYELWYYKEYGAYLRALYQESQGKELRMLRTLKKFLVRFFRTHPQMRKPFQSGSNAKDCLNPTFIHEMEAVTDKPELRFSYDPIGYIRNGGSRNRLDNVAVQGAESGVRYMVPFLDYRVIDYAVSIPRSQHHNGCGNRWIYLQTFSKYLPKSLTDTHYKSTVSIAGHQPTRRDMEVLLEARDRILSYLDKAYWGKYLNFEYIEGISASDSVTGSEMRKLSEMLEKLFYCMMIQNASVKAKEVSKTL